MRFHNLERGVFETQNPFGIPDIKPNHVSNLPDTWLPCNYAKTTKKVEQQGLHFFVDDYQFERYWNRPSTYLNQLQRFACVLSPDFSLYRNTPSAIQIYNHYRKHWLAAYWQANGIDVIPTISWSDESSYDWCFCGTPKNSIVAISTVGCMKNTESTALFELGFEQMQHRLQPSKILCYGLVPEKHKDILTPIGCFWRELEHACRGTSLHGLDYGTPRTAGSGMAVRAKGVIQT